jgi:hypothetical protein
MSSYFSISLNKSAKIACAVEDDKNSRCTVERQRIQGVDEIPPRRSGDRANPCVTLYDAQMAVGAEAPVAGN